jgi:hypothetical protein
MERFSGNPILRPDEESMLGSHEGYSMQRQFTSMAKYTFSIGQLATITFQGLATQLLLTALP